MRFRALLAWVSLMVVAGVSALAEEPSSREIGFDGLKLSSFEAANYQPLVGSASPFTRSNRSLAPVTIAQMSLLSYPTEFGLFGATPLDYLAPVMGPYPTRSIGKPVSPGFRDLPAFLSSFNHASGEVGFFYGKGAGKLDLETTSSYIIGEIDNGTTQITVGASYNKVSARQPPR
jgi:hypothetical protein